MNAVPGISLLRAGRTLGSVVSKCLLILLQTAALNPAPLSDAPFCSEVAGGAVSLTQLQSGQNDRLRDDLIFNAIRLCPVEFVQDAALFAEANSNLEVPVGNHNDRLNAALRGAAARSLAGVPKHSTVVARIAERLGSPRAVSTLTLREIAKRDSHDLAALAARQSLRAGDTQTILLDGLFITWIADREALNLAFLNVPGSQKWLKPYPPGIVEVGPPGNPLLDEQLAEAIRRRAKESDGPVDMWFRGFRVAR